MSDENKMKITCPSCGQVFSVPLPPPEISNNFHTSVVAVAHDKLIRCINARCSVPFVMVVTGAQLAMGAQPVGEEVASQFEGSKVIKPSLSIVQ